MDILKAELEKRAQTYQQILQDEGYGAKTPEWDERTRTWDIRVKYEGLFVLIMLDFDDPDFVRIVLPNFYDIDPEHHQSALLALEIANKKCKVAKVYLNAAQNDTIAAVEFLDDGTGINARFLIRYVDMLVHAAKFFAESYKGLVNVRIPELSLVPPLASKPH